MKLKVFTITQSKMLTLVAFKLKIIEKMFLFSLKSFEKYKI
jgi:hypothetical protein